MGPRRTPQPGKQTKAPTAAPTKSSARASGAGAYVQTSSKLPILAQVQAYASEDKERKIHSDTVKFLS
ncbi:hypothetical protein NDU88_007856 [Pleurodeles waltl]|uniref:Uncharacterized protein n=1 Tax=Pleurodeles waltl TaxID=8319 RepID=A0AAV7N3A8_PLEWA|nr:hypothetical protein NDU88_007856 [Pleurodeles waltl]